MEFYKRKAKSLVYRYGAIAIIVGLVLSTTHFLPARATTAASFSLSPASQTVNVGDTLTVNIMLDITSDSSGTVDNALASLNYPANMFTVSNTDLVCNPSGGSLPSGLSKSIDSTNGIVKIGCYANVANGESQIGAGTYTFASITFHAVASGAPGAPNITFRTDPAAGTASTESMVVSSSTDTLGSTTGGTYTVSGATPASVSVTAPNDGDTVSGTAVTLSAVPYNMSTVQSVKFQVDGTDVGTPDTTAPYSYTWDSRTVANGSHTVNAIATDGTTPVLSNTVTVTTANDFTAPNTTIDSGPSGTVTTNNASFSFSSDDVTAQFECDLDSGGWSSCTTPKSYTGLTDGSHTFSVRAKDAVPNYDATPATQTWTVDTADHTAPTDPGTPTAGNSVTTNQRPTWTWTASGDAVGVNHYQVEWCDSTDFTTCGSNVDTTATNSYTHTADLAYGVWYFRVKAYDAANNASNYSLGNVDIQQTPLTISGQNVTPTDTGATITWNTNVAADTTVQYGVGTPGIAFSNTGSTSDSNSGVINHTALLSNLLPCATYHFQATSVDSQARTVAGTDTQISTTGCAGGVTVLAAASQTIVAANGGNLTYGSGDDQVSLDVPADAAATDLNYQVQHIGDAAQTATTAPDGLTGVPTKSYQFNALANPSTAQTQFDQPLTVTMHYSSDNASEFKPATLAIYRRETGPWTKLDGCTVDTDARTVTCTTDHFSSFALFGEQQSAVQQAINTVTSLPNTGAGRAAIVLSLFGAITAGVVYRRRHSPLLGS